jgi:hypothetical protein
MIRWKNGNTGLYTRGTLLKRKPVELWDHPWKAFFSYSGITNSHNSLRLYEPPELSLGKYF